MNAIDKSRLFLACLAIAEQESHEVRPISEAVFAGLKEDAARDWYDEGPPPSVRRELWSVQTGD